MLTTTGLVLTITLAVGLMFAAVLAWLAAAQVRAHRATDVRVLAMVAVRGGGIARDTTGRYGHPRQWAARVGDRAEVLPLRCSEWLEETLVDGRVRPSDGPEIDGGWSRMELTRAGTRALHAAGAGTVVDLAARRVRTVGVPAAVERAA